MFLAAATAAAAAAPGWDSNRQDVGGQTSAAEQPADVQMTAPQLDGATAGAVLAAAAEEADSAQPAALLALLECVR